MSNTPSKETQAAIERLMRQNTILLEFAIKHPEMFEVKPVVPYQATNREVD